MSDYIKREDAIARMLNYKQACNDIENFKEARIAERTIDFLRNIPAADVVERKKGRNISQNGFLCSVCSFGDFGGFHGYMPNFCPNCGAEMRKGGES